MSVYEETLRLFEEMDGLDDSFIEESMLPDQIPTSKKKLHFLSAFLGSGLGVAILCAVVSVGLLVALIQAGLLDGSLSGNMSPGADAPAGNHPDYQEEITDEPVTLPEESTRVPAGTRSEDESGLYYVSYGDGTCICMGYVRYEEQSELSIPTYSPHGDVVTAIYSYAFRNCLSLQSVSLPAGLRSLDHRTFPMEVPIYHLYGHILSLGSSSNPYILIK